MEKKIFMINLPKISIKIHFHSINICVFIKEKSAHISMAMIKGILFQR
jgi:hypothetical protein